MGEFSEPDFGDADEADFGFGHNGGPAMDFEGEEIANPEVLTAAAQGRLNSFIERIENIEETIKEHQDERKEVYAELKGEGFDAKIVRQVIRRRKQDKVKREEEQALLDLYESCLEMIK